MASGDKKRGNLVRTARITISTTSLNEKYLDQLVLKGQKGKNAADAAERIVSDYIERSIREGGLKEIQPTADDLTADAADQD